MVVKSANKWFVYSVRHIKNVCFFYKKSEHSIDKRDIKMGKYVHVQQSYFVALSITIFKYCRVHINQPFCSEKC